MKQSDESNLTKHCLKNKRHKIIIYGGNGFVGTHLAERLSKEDACIMCLSRSGYKPLHLKDKPWSESIRWCKGDANTPDIKLLSEADVVIILVGSAPLPTFSKTQFTQKVHDNGSAPSNVIKAASKAGVKRIILMGAQIPFFLNTNAFAYTKGKNVALQSAIDFASTSEQHGAIVLQPGAIYGKRHLRNGKVISLDKVMSPASRVMPWQFISVTRIAEKITNVAINHQEYDGKLTILKHGEI